MAPVAGRATSPIFDNVSRASRRSAGLLLFSAVTRGLRRSSTFGSSFLGGLVGSSGFGFGSSLFGFGSSALGAVGSSFGGGFGSAFFLGGFLPALFSLSPPPSL